MLLILSSTSIWPKNNFIGALSIQLPLRDIDLLQNNIFHK